jgi:hypothetical protein
MARTYVTREKQAQAPPFEIEVDGRKMTFTPPLTGALLMAALDGSNPDPARQLKSIQSSLNWLGEGLSDEDGEWILNRIRDPADPFDIDDAQRLVTMVIEEMTNRPTLPSSALSGSPSGTNGSTDGRPVAPLSGRS